MLNEQQRCGVFFPWIRCSSHTFKWFIHVNIRWTGAISQGHKQFRCWYATFAVCSTCTWDVNTFTYTRTHTSMSVIASIKANWSKGKAFFLKKGRNMKYSRDMCKEKKKKAQRWPTAISQSPFYVWNVCGQAKPVCEGATVSKMASHGQARCLSTHRLINLNVCPRSVPSLTVSPHSSSGFSQKAPACQANRPSQALISGSMFTFYCALWHPLISLIPVWYQIIDTVGLLAKSGVL